MRSRHWSAECGVGLVVMLLAAGCGGKKPPAAPVVTGGGLSKSPAAVNVPSGKPLGGAEADADAAPQTDQGASVAVHPDDYTVVSEEPAWTITGRADDRPEAFQVVAVATDSSDFAVLRGGAARRGAAGGGTSSAAVADSATPTRPVKLPEGFRPAPEYGYAPDGAPWRIVCEADGAEMAYVPAGVFLQGDDEGPANARPRREVLLDAFYIDVQEVTVERFVKIRDDMREVKLRPALPLNATEDTQQPALGATWGEARSYARQTGRELPTEAQWEKAARGTHGFRYVWGTGREIWHRERRPGQIDPVGSFPTDVSPFGVSDLAGNAREWCADFYTDDAFKESSGEATVRNPAGPRNPGSGATRVIRGCVGTWDLATRSGGAMTGKLADVGFRCVLNLTGEAAAEGEDAEAPAEPPRRRPNGVVKKKAPKAAL